MKDSIEIRTLFISLLFGIGIWIVIALLGTCNSNRHKETGKAVEQYLKNRIDSLDKQIIYLENKINVIDKKIEESDKRILQYNDKIRILEAKYKQKKQKYEKASSDTLLLFIRLRLRSFSK